ncbi:MAG: hypothetical protein ACQ9MH_12115 [Nitrospinales bacterium]
MTELKIISSQSQDVTSQNRKNKSMQDKTTWSAKLKPGPVKRIITVAKIKIRKASTPRVFGLNFFMSAVRGKIFIYEALKLPLQRRFFKAMGFR